jgi:hypothetical protein
MLSDAEQRRLKEIERGLQSDDPGFADRLDHGMQRNPRNWPRMTAGWLIAAAWIMGLSRLGGVAPMGCRAGTFGGIARSGELGGSGSPMGARENHRTG